MALGNDQICISQGLAEVMQLHRQLSAPKKSCLLRLSSTTK